MGHLPAKWPETHQEQVSWSFSETDYQLLLHPKSLQSNAIKHLNFKWEMVRFDGETSNALLDVLEDWHTVLAAEKLDQHPMLRGPRP